MMYPMYTRNVGCVCQRKLETFITRPQVTHTCKCLQPWALRGLGEHEMADYMQGLEK